MKQLLRNPFIIMLFYTGMLFGLALFCGGDLYEILDGLVKIIKSSDILVTDYIELVGLSAAFTNAAIMGLLCVILLKVTRHVPTGKTIMAFWMFCGFSLFGKNLLNTVPIIFGGYLYSRFIKEEFRDNIVFSLLCTGLAPAVSHVYFLDQVFHWTDIVIGSLFGMLIGFVIIPVMKSTAKLHTGHNLYNSGFSAGLVGMLIMAIFNGMGIAVPANDLWSKGNNTIIFSFLMLISLSLIIIGFITGDYYAEVVKTAFENYRGNNYKEDEEYQHGNDYSYTNMGILGGIGSVLMIALNVELSGPVLGAIFTLIGFGCCGKNAKNVIPVMIGAIIAGGISVYGLDTPTVSIAILFSTCLAPIVRDYGIVWGMIAGALHMIFVMSTGAFHGGMNLYNNGLAGGFVAIILVPLIEAFNRRYKVISKQ